MASSPTPEANRLYDKLIDDIETELCKLEPDETDDDEIVEEIVEDVFHKYSEKINRTFKDPQDIKERILSEFYDYTPAIIWKAAYGDTQGVKARLRRGDPVDKTDNTGDTPLHKASQEGNIEIVKILLRAGASVDKTDNGGVTPLFCAAENGHIDVVKALLNKDANVNLENEYGDTPLHAAAEDGNIEIVRALLKTGAIVDKENNDGKTPLSIAIERNNEGVAELILTKNAITEVLERINLPEDILTKVASYLGGKRKTKKSKRKQKRTKRNRTKSKRFTGKYERTHVSRKQSMKKRHRKS